MALIAYALSLLLLILQYSNAKEGLGLKGPRTQDMKESSSSSDQWVFEHQMSSAHFRKIGRLIGSTNYGHLVIKYDLNAETDKITKVCGYSSLLWAWVRHVFEDQHKHSVKNATEHFAHSLDVKCALIRTLYSDARKIWLHRYDPGFETSDNMPPRSVTKGTSRQARQLIMGTIAIMSLVAAISSFIFTPGQLMGIAQSGPDDDTKTILQMHENKITVHDSLVEEMTRSERNLVKVARYDWQEYRINSYYGLLSESANNLQWEIERLVIGMHALTEYRLSPNLVSSKDLGAGFVKLKAQLNRKGLIPLVESVEDLYRCSTSHVLYRNNSLHIILHIPAYREDSLLELYRFVEAPIDLSSLPRNGGHQSRHLWIPKPEGQLLAVSPSRALFRPMEEEEFGLCRAIGRVHYCPSNNFYDRRIRKSCIASLFLNEAEDIRDTCEWEPKPREDHLSMVAANKFILYQSLEGTVERHCGTNHSSVTFSGVRQIIVNPGCRAISTNFVFDGALNVYLDPDEITTHWINLDPDSVQIPDDSDIQALFQKMEAHGQKRSLTFRQLNEVYWQHQHSRFIIISIITLVVVVSLLILCCVSFSTCPILGHRFQWCGKCLNLCLPCCLNHYLCAKNETVSPGNVEERVRMTGIEEPPVN